MADAPAPQPSGDTALAIVTMVYEDDIFLDIFLRYWARFVDLKSIYVLIHADYEKYERLAAGTNTIRINRPPIHQKSEMYRWHMISHLVSGLTFQFDQVLYCDVDEIIAVDPDVSDNPARYMLSQPDPLVAPVGVDLVHYPASEPEDYSPDRPVLDQRRHFAYNSWYSKPAITRKPVLWASGGHHCNMPEFRVDPALTLFHLRLFDSRIFGERRLSRLQMITDPETGEAIQGLGGRSWRSEVGEIDSYLLAPETPEPEEIGAPHQNRKSYQLKRMDKGFYIRSPMRKKRLQPLPRRYHGLF